LLRVLHLNYKRKNSRRSILRSWTYHEWIFWRSIPMN